MPTPEELRRKITELQKELRESELALDRSERSCTHDWSTPEYTPERREAYTIPGDPPGTMGVDWRGPCYVPAETIQKWTRRCRKCNKRETTTRTEDKITKVPKFY